MVMVTLIVNLGHEHKISLILAVPSDAVRPDNLNVFVHYVLPN